MCTVPLGSTSAASDTHGNGTAMAVSSIVNADFGQRRGMLGLDTAEATGDADGATDRANGGFGASVDRSDWLEHASTARPTITMTGRMWTEAAPDAVGQRQSAEAETLTGD